MDNLYIILLIILIIGVAAFPVRDDSLIARDEPVLELPALSRHRRNGMRVESKRHKRKKNKKFPNAGHNFSGKPKSPELKQPKSESKYCSSNCEGKRKRHL